MCVCVWFCKFGILRWEASLFPSRYSSGITRIFFNHSPSCSIYVLIIQESLSVRVIEGTK